MYTVKDLLDMSLPELKKELLEARKTYAAMSIAVKIGKDKNTAELRKNRKYLAQLKTVMQKAPLEPKLKQAEATGKKSTKKDNK